METQNPNQAYESYVNVKMIDLWVDMYQSAKGLDDPKAVADKAVSDFKNFLQGA